MTPRLMQSRLIRLFQSDVVIKISLVLTVLSIFVPFVYMKIGPMGYRYYGPNVPDIYIFGGYIFGKLFGGPKLTQISPNKTWAGAIGSIILSQFAFLIFFLNSNYKFNITIIFMQLFLSIIGQFGDILMSYVKRKNNKKDTSNFIPGHGGFLDRVDGLIWIIIFANFFI